MAGDTTYHLILGVRVPRDKLLKRVSAPGCPHPEATGKKFCPECGVKSAADSWEPVEGLFFDGSAARFLTGHVAVFNLRRPRGDEGDERRWAYVGMAAGPSPGIKATTYQTPLERYVPSQLLNDMRFVEKLQTALAPLGLWDEALYGVWMYPDHDY
jgi:hypothetical protein